MLKRFFVDECSLLIFIWTAPASIIGAAIGVFQLVQKRIDFIHRIDGPCVLIGLKPTKWFSGGSFGPFIFLPTTRCHEFLIAHEYGHFRQSLIFGPLYLLIIGIPSLINNVRSRFDHKFAYYERFPEKWANKLGGAIL